MHLRTRAYRTSGRTVPNSKTNPSTACTEFADTVKQASARAVVLRTFATFEERSVVAGSAARPKRVRAPLPSDYILHVPHSLRGRDSHPPPS